jgi:dephospho-CoA kinase
MPEAGATANRRGAIAAAGVANRMAGMGSMIGLTGGIGSGKSTVAAMLADRGAVVIDADRVAHEVYLPGTEGHESLVQRFGTEILGEGGVVDRGRLGALVFNDPQALADLNGIIHPLVRQEVARRLIAANEEDPDAVVVIEAALMTETGWTGGAGTVWTVIASPDIAAERLVAVRGMDPNDVQIRIRAQASNEQRRKFATTIIENDASLEDLEATVDAMWRDHLDATLSG